MRDFTLEKFTNLNTEDSQSAYVEALEAFDSIGQLQELKQLALQWGNLKPDTSLLDIGCGFGLETLRLASLTKDGFAAGIDLSREFIGIAGNRAEKAGMTIDFRVADAGAIPFPDEHFDYVRAERILIYLKDVANALEEARRVLRPGGRLALIEPDFSSTNINVPNRELVRKVMAHEVDTAVIQSWLPGRLTGMLQDLEFSSIELASRVLVFPQGLAASYFENTGRHAATAGVIDSGELEEWLTHIERLSKSETLFGSVGYFLFTAQKQARKKADSGQEVPSIT